MGCPLNFLQNVGMVSFDLSKMQVTHAICSSFIWAKAALS